MGRVLGFRENAHGSVSASRCADWRGRIAASPPHRAAPPPIGVRSRRALVVACACDVCGIGVFACAVIWVRRG